MDILIYISVGIIAALVVYLFFDEEKEEDFDSRLEKYITTENTKKEFDIIDDDMSEKSYAFLEPIVNKVMETRINIKSLKQMMMEAGRSYEDRDVYVFTAKKILLAGIFLLLSIFMVLFLASTPVMKLSICILAFSVGYILPDFKLKSEIRKKKEEIMYNLPDALDLLTVCVEAGLGLDAALIKVSQEQSRTAPILARELGRVSKDILAGMSRQEAFRNLALRNNVDDLKSFVALLIQTDKLGTSISQSLRVYSDTIRTKRRQRVESLAAQASVKMVFPLVLFILPAMFIVLLAPAAISLFNNFANSKF